MARRILMVLGLLLVALVIAAVTVWGSLVLFYLATGPEPARKAFTWGFAALGLVTITALVVSRLRWPACVAYAVALVWCWWPGTWPRRGTTATGSRRWRCCPTPPPRAIW